MASSNSEDKRDRADAGAKSGLDRPARGFPFRLLLLTIVGFAAAAGIGYYAWNLRGEHIESRHKLATARDQVRDLTADKERGVVVERRLAACLDANEEAEARCTAAEQSVAAMEENLQATRTELDEVRRQREEAARRIAAFKDLTGKFKQMIDAGRLDVVTRDGRMILQLPAGVLFASGSAELSRDGELALMEVAVQLRRFTDRQFMVAGHTDNQPVEKSPEGRFKNNWELSTARAVTVTQFLIQARIKPENLVAAGYGEYDPLASNKTAQGRQQNRRIEVVLLPRIEELPSFGDLGDQDSGADTAGKPAGEGSPLAEAGAAP